MKTIAIKEKILGKNDELAAANRKLLTEKEVFVINLLGSPGAGKTSVLEKVIERMEDQSGIAVIEGDIYTSRDAERLEKFDIQVVQINTGGACHLDASMIKKALCEIHLSEVKLLIIENVGNLVCPASFDLGEDIKVTVFSVTEGSDKLLKYHGIFQKSEALLINKIDLKDYTDYSFISLKSDLKTMNKKLDIFNISCQTGEGIGQFCDYLKEQIK